MQDRRKIRRDLTRANKLDPDKFAVARNFWIANRNIFLARGIDPARWAQQQVQTFAWPEARACFIELSQKECTPEVLAAILALYRHSPLFERIWASLVGDPRKRQRVAKALEKAALRIEDVFRDVLAAEDDHVRAQYVDMGRIPLSRLTSELRFYSWLMGMAGHISSETETRSLREFLKYLLVGYIKRATGRFHDREVSALLAELDNAPNFNERAQSMWRSRNYKRLDAHHWKVADFVADMALVIVRRT